MLQAPPKLVVLGSINMDLVVRCQRLSRPGETVIAKQSRESPGGKGANQSVAAARLGAQVTHIGRVGSDSFADRLLENLEREQISCSQIQRTAEVSSGLAVVMVEDTGENSIVVVPGANAAVSPEDVHACAEVIQQADLLLVQLEIPIESVLAGMEIARAAGVQVILDPAPAPETCPAELLQVDLLCPNQAEAEQLLGMRIDSRLSAVQATRAFIDRGARQAIVTLGSRGAVLCDGTEVEFISPYSVETVDTTAAGDAFAGALGVALAEGRSLSAAVRFACAAGAWAASQPGAQLGMPFRNNVEQLMNFIGHA